MNVIEGGCSCDSVRYSLLDKPMFTHCCHCHLCQQLTGSAFIINSSIEGSNFKLNKGNLTNFVGPSGSGSKHKLKRCSKCGDPIVSYFGQTEYLAWIKVASLDNPDLFPPQAHIFVNTKLKWLLIGDEIPQFSGIYNFKETWPLSSYKRLSLVRKKQTAL